MTNQARLQGGKFIPIIISDPGIILNMKSSEVRQKYLKFFEKHGHKILPSSSLVPENDPTTLFTSSGMQPMIPYLLGQTHPEGDSLTDSQKCFRSQDFEEVGDNRHNTFFEMLGNWSLGAYWKREQLSWLFEFLTNKEDGLGLDPEKLYVSVFEGTDALPKDEESIQIWQELFQHHGMEAKVGERIRLYGVKKNWWSRAGTPFEMPEGEPGGPDSEVFYDYGAELNLHENSSYKDQVCHPNCDCGRFGEIGNSVFMQYIKQADGSFKDLPKRNVDFGGGLERLTAASENQPDIFKTDSFWGIIEELTSQLGIDYEENSETKHNLQIIADHIRAATFLIKDGVLPSNKLQGYILRRLLRRAAVKINELKPNSMPVLPKLVDPVIDIYEGTGYFQIGDWNPIREVVEQELAKFQKTLNQGLREVSKIDKIDAKKAFDLYQTYGFPLEITAEIFKDNGQEINLAEFQEEFKKHQELSRSTSAGLFKGGLQDQSEQNIKYHTATHLLNKALHIVLGNHVVQRGSNITTERLRFDFPNPTKLTAEQIKQIEEIVNEQIQKDLPVNFETKDQAEALKSGAFAAFGERYPDKVTVYTIGNPGQLFSQEICGGPHVEHTGSLGIFKIQKEEAVSAGVRRIYATLS